MPLMDIMGSIFKGLMDPTALAREMAENNISPEDLMAQVQKTQQLQTMPTAGAQNQSINDRGSPFEFPSQEGRNRDLAGVDNTMMDFFKWIAGNRQMEAQAAAQGQPIPPGSNMPDYGAVPSLPNSRLSDMMQPATQATAATGLTGSAPGGQQTQMAMQPLPPQLQGLPAQLMSAGSSVPPPNIPAEIAPMVSQFPARPEVIPGNGPILPNGAPLPTSSPQGQLGLAMQPNTQAMQPNRPGIERPASATGPHLGKDAQGVRQIALSTWYQGGVTNPYGLAALTSTGEHESGFNPANLNRSWSDPSESGGKGTSGGMFSWRNERLSALQAFAKDRGESGNGSPQTQAAFFLQENPQLKDELNGAKSVDEAQAIMNRNIRFAGYDREGGEAGRRLQTARTLVPQMEQFIKDPQKPPVVAPPTVASAADTIAPFSTPGASVATGLNPFSALDALDTSNSGGGAEIDMNLPKPPAPVAPQPGRYDVNPQAMMAMLQMLGPMAGGVQMPSLMQLMGRG